MADRVVEEHLPIEEMEMFARFEEVADCVWDLVAKWVPTASETVGRQLIRAVDSVGANLVEGDGRFSIPDSVHFFIIARASSREARLWIRRAIQRHIVVPDEGERLIRALESSTRQLNHLIRYRRSMKDANRVREIQPAYLAPGDDPFTSVFLD